MRSMVLQPVRRADVPFMMECRNDPETLKWALGSKEPATITEVTEGIQFLFTPGAKKPIGYGQALVTYELCWALHPDNRGYGSGVSAVEGLLSRMQANGKHDCFAWIHDGNTASTKTAQRAGMKRLAEGVGKLKGLSLWYYIDLFR